MNSGKIQTDEAGTWLDRQIPSRFLADAETARRARLITQFGIVGSFFGIIYAIFYLVIGHIYGAAIILICTCGVMVSPFLMRGEKGSISRAGDFFSMILVLGFLGLCCVEGGVHGHALAWLANVPLCALLLMGMKAAWKWVIISFLAIGFIVSLNLCGIDLPMTYDKKWNPLLSAAGYLGLVVFMSLLGFIFEKGRATAFDRMQTALGQLAKTNVRLVHMNREKNEFLGIVAHDLKNPLTIIMGSGEILKITNDLTQVPALADSIVFTSERMHKLISNLLDVNAIEEGKFASNLECCDFGNLATQSAEYNLPGAVRKNIAIEIDIPQSIYVRADVAAAVQVLDNLISNAIKYSPLHTTVYLRLMAEENHAVFMVRDLGPGISSMDQKKLFEKFSRLSALPTGGESSTGLGLAIAKRLAEAMAGTIECHSQLGNGSTFQFRLPRWEGESPLVIPGRKDLAESSIKAGKLVAL